VRAVVKNMTSVKKARARGAIIFAEVELAIIEAIAGNPPATLTLEMPSGRLGEEEPTGKGAPWGLSPRWGAVTSGLRLRL